MKLRNFSSMMISPGHIRQDDNNWKCFIEDRDDEDPRKLVEQLKNKIKTMNTNELIKYKPYAIGRYTKEGYAEIIFQSEGVMTVPKNSAASIVELLNSAFNNGVKMAIKNSKSTQMQTGSITPDQPIIKSNPMPQEELHPINSYKKR